MLATALTVHYSAQSPNPLDPHGTMNNLGGVKIQLNPQMLGDVGPLWTTYTTCTTSSCKANTVLVSSAFAWINQAQANIAP
jgi:hypothetical protein